MAYLAAAATIIPAAIKIFSSSDQASQAQNLSKGLNRPNYNNNPYAVPSEVEEMLTRARRRVADSRLPGASLIENKQDANTANAVAAAKETGASSNDVLNTISAIYGKQMDATNDIGVKSAINYQNRSDKNDAAVDSALGTSASFKDQKYRYDSGNYDKSFELNQLDPYKATAATISSLTNASAQNKYGAAEDLSTLGALLAQLNSAEGSGSTSQKKFNPKMGKNNNDDNYDPYTTA